jgi:hypothetical protein
MLSKSVRVVAAMLLSMFIVGKSQAVVIYFSPAVQPGLTGDFVSMDLVISGLGDGVAPSIGDWDFDISYDDLVLSVDGWSFSSELGDIDLGEATDLSLGDNFAGLLGLSVLSLLNPAELDVLQGGDVTLATLTFEVLDLGIGEFTDVGIDFVFALGDGFGDPLNVSGTRVGRISNAVGVPEPGAAILLLTGLVLLARRPSRR